MSLNAKITIESYLVKYLTSPTNPSITIRGKAFWNPNDRRNYYAELYFKPNGSVLPDDIMQHVNGNDIIKLYYFISDFQNIIDLLRNEGPLTLLLSDGGRRESNVNGIYSYEEAVGEGDGKEIIDIHVAPQVPA